MGGASFVGRVVSNRMQKTVVVAVDYVVWQPKLKVYEKRTSKHFAHDEQQACNIGDTVRIGWTRRRSKHKHYAVEEILRKVNVYSPALGQAAAERADAAPPVSRTEASEADYAAAQRRLAALRAAYAQDAAAAQLAAEGGSSNGGKQQQQHPAAAATPGSSSQGGSSSSSGAS